MRTLFDEQYAPVTSKIGYLELPFEETLEVLTAWRRGLYGEPTVRDLSRDGFPLAIHALEPLVAGARPRELLVEIGDWTAYFDCLMTGTDPISAIGYLAKVARRRGLAIATHPHVLLRVAKEPLRYGAVNWELFADHPTHFLNYARTIVLAHDGSRWVFQTSGEPQPYEDLERYRARRVRDRFDSRLVEAYSRAIGLDVFNGAAYGPRVALVESDVMYPPNALKASLADVQAAQGILPGRGAMYPG